MDEQWHEKLKRRRLRYTVKQKDLACAAEISAQYLSYIESGKVSASRKTKKKLEEALETLHFQSPLEVIFDYCRIRFKTNDARHVIEDIMGIKLRHMAFEERGLYGYASKYFFGNIMVLLSPDEELGTLLELRGQGCREFSTVLEGRNKSWYEFMLSCEKEEAIFKRIDIAINDKVGMLDVPELMRKCNDDEVITEFQKQDMHASVGGLKGEKVGMGNTLYLGSTKSEIYFCIYEKDKEQYIKKGIALEDAEVKNRFEIRLKNERATYAMQDFIDHNDIEKTAFEIINKYVCFIVSKSEMQEIEDIRKYGERCYEPTDEWWRFIGGKRGKLKLTAKAEPYSIDKTLSWIHRQVAPSLKMGLELDAVNGTSFINDMVEQAELNDRHKKILAQLTTPINEIVTDN